MPGIIGGETLFILYVHGSWRLLQYLQKKQRKLSTCTICGCARKQKSATENEWWGGSVRISTVSVKHSWKWQIDGISTNSTLKLFLNVWLESCLRYVSIQCSCLILYIVAGQMCHAVSSLLTFKKYLCSIMLVTQWLFENNKQNFKDLVSEHHIYYNWMQEMIHIHQWVVTTPEYCTHIHSDMQVVNTMVWCWHGSK